MASQRIGPCALGGEWSGQNSGVFLEHFQRKASELLPQLDFNLYSVFTKTDPGDAAAAAAAFLDEQ